MAMTMARFGSLFLLSIIGTVALPAPGLQKTGASSPAELLPRVADWKTTENIQRYNPETLYEYIDGAAEAYLGYDFKELAVAEFRSGRAKAMLTAEIYDMGSAVNAFGIYSAERFPESRFIPVGVQGYLEEGTLNFLAGRYYVKLLCYEGGGQTGEFLKLFAGAIVDKIKDPGGFPAPLQAFPKDGLVANGEKFVLRNALGFKFLRNAYLASYRLADQEFEAFLIDGKTAEDAEAMFKQFLDHFGGAAAAKGGAVRFKDPYLRNVYAARSGTFICGVTKLKDGQDALGEKMLARLIAGLKK